MVRVAGIYNQIKHKVSFLSHDGLTSQKQLARIIIKTKRLLAASNEAWSNLKVDLSKEGILFVFIIFNVCAFIRECLPKVGIAIL